MRWWEGILGHALLGFGHPWLTLPFLVGVIGVLAHFFRVFSRVVSPFWVKFGLVKGVGDVGVRV